MHNESLVRGSLAEQVGRVAFVLEWIGEVSKCLCSDHQRVLPDVVMGLVLSGLLLWIRAKFPLVSDSLHMLQRIPHPQILFKCFQRILGLLCSKDNCDGRRENQSDGCCS